MIIQASAPHCLFNLGTWTDTGFADHGTVLTCAVQHYANVSLLHGKQPGIHLHACNTDSSIHRFFRNIAHHFFLDRLEAWVTDDNADDLSPALAVALVSACAFLAERSMTPGYLAIVAHELHRECGGPAGIHPHLAAAFGNFLRCAISPYPRPFVSIHNIPAERRAELAQRIISVKLASHIPARFDRLAADRWRLPNAAPLRTLAQQAVQIIDNGAFSDLHDTVIQHESLLRQLVPELITPEVQQIDEIADKHAAIFATNLYECCGTLFCQPEKLSGLEEDLQQAGICFTHIRIDTTGVRVWSYDPSRKKAPIPVIHSEQAA